MKGSKASKAGQEATKRGRKRAAASEGVDAIVTAETKNPKASKSKQAAAGKASAKGRAAAGAKSPADTGKPASADAKPLLKAKEALSRYAFKGLDDDS